MRIRREADADHAAIRRVVGAAFGSPVEPDLVDAIRASDRFLPELSLVAEVDGEIVGHILVSYVDLEPGPVRVLQVAPLAVAPAHQRRGVGGALMREALRLAEERGAPLVLVEGDPRYYGRFGFRRSDEAGITAPANVSPQYLMARILSAHDPAIRGRLVYPEAFATVS
ncbi:MAG TPA: N-acetyltransferase [Gaiellaceae bacterium]